MSARPPLGLIPWYIHNEERILSIQRAINRYAAEKLPIPVEWITEYNALTKIYQIRLKKHG